MHTVKDMLDAKGRDVWSIAPSGTVYEAIEEMARREVGALTVVDGSSIQGIISERDYARKVILKGKSADKTRVADIMTRDLVTVDEDHTVDECMALMARNRIRHLPVVVNDTLLGIIAVGDVMKFIIDDQEATIGELESYIMEETGGSG
ncbi:MAG: CBS domain-containing protein [Pseudomonadales bacterium]|nr:CBS domain-containing protein [Pseudomonadales bacterium]